MQWSLHRYKCLWGVGVKTGIQVSKNELYTHTHIYIYTLDYDRLEILSFIKKKKKKLMLHSLYLILLRFAFYQLCLFAASL